MGLASEARFGRRSTAPFATQLRLPLDNNKRVHKRVAALHPITPATHSLSHPHPGHPRNQTSSQSIINFHRRPATRADGRVVGHAHRKAISLTPIPIATSSTPPSINLGRNRKAPPLAPAVPIGCNHSVADNKRRRPIRHRGPNSFVLGKLINVESTPLICIQYCAPLAFETACRAKPGQGAL